MQMERFLFASAEGDLGAEALADACLAQLGTIPPQANVGFVYATDQLGGRLRPVLDRLRRAAPHVHWVGSLGMGICVSGREIYDVPAVAVMVGDFPADGVRLLPSAGEGFDALPEALREWLAGRGLCFGLLHGDPANPRTPELIHDLAARLPAAFLNGGLTSSNVSNYQIADEVVSGGLSGVLFDESVEVVTDHTQGCSPLGPVHAVTDAERNVLAQLDRRPALEVMKEDIGEVLARDLRKVAGYIFVGLPIAGSDTGDYLVRNLLAIDTGKGLLAVGDYLDGQERLMFCRRDGNTAREDMQRMLGRVAKRVGDRPIRGGVYVTCLGRGRHQFGAESEELGMVREALGEFPLVGFFANGELYNGRLYGYTGVLTLFL